MWTCEPSSLVLERIYPIIKESFVCFSSWYHSFDISSPVLHHRVFMAQLHLLFLRSKRDLFKTFAKTYQLLINPVILSGEFRPPLLISANETAGTKNIINFVSVFCGDTCNQLWACQDLWLRKKQELGTRNRSIEFWKLSVTYRRLTMTISLTVKMSFGWWSFAVKGFWALCDNIYECVSCYNGFHGNAVKRLWALCRLYVGWLVIICC
jgi:hypothetical protein